MISIFVTIKIKPGFRERFCEASLGDARGSVRDEPGCYRFDILQDSSDPNCFHLYEVYADEAALGATETLHTIRLGGQLWETGLTASLSG